MKRFKIIVFVTLLLLTFRDFSLSQDIHATVDGNNVTLWETGAQRNCGAVYEMTVNLEDYHMKWVQVDSGMIAFCLCTFDLSVTYGPLEQGDYSVDVYFTSPVEPGEYYEGSTVFTIGGKRDVADGGIISQYQSECYTGLDDPGPAEEFRIYPVPLEAGEILNVEATPNGRDAMLEIFTLTGKRVFCRQYDGNQKIQDRFIKEELFPVPGIYMLRLKTSNIVFTRKVTVL
jgi:hypothetical protein